MKKQIRRLAAGLLAAAMAVVLAACGSVDVPEPSQDTEGAAASLASVVSNTATSVYLDVPNDAPYAEAVMWCYEKNLMGGTGNGLFEPDSVLDRRTMATVLYRAEGSPSVSGELRFTDVEKGSWYSDAVVWADSSGIMGGYGNGIFGSGDAISKEMLKVIMDRYMGRGDTFISFVRHEYYRRILCDKLGRLVEEGLYPCDLETLGGIVEDICHKNARGFFGL